jgi:soluble lytic murein transglycosylase
MIRADDDVARLDRLLWEHQEPAARQQLTRVDPDHKRLGEARLAFASDASNADTLAAGLREEPGLIYERIRYLRNHDRDDDAIDLLRRAPRDPLHADLWWTERAVLIQHALQKNKSSAAYDLAQNSDRPNATIYADAEWLSGWIALRFLDDATQGLDHFSRLYDHVTLPRSRSRAAYWAGRAAEARGLGDEAVRWFGLAARNIDTFYGQMAEDRLHQDQLAELPPDPVPTADDRAWIDRGTMPELARLLVQIQEPDLARFFLLRESELAKTTGQRVLTANLAISLGQPDIAVSIAQQTEHEGSPLFQAGYPIIPVTGDPALILSLIRKESGFHSGLVSSAGARGLMQLMPPTAAQLDKLTAQLIYDPALNVTLGSAYVGTLLKDFDGSYLLTAAAYNAGPNRVRQWLGIIGDPRAPDADPVDWIERIPYWETRDYVQRVLEATQIYRRKLGRS